MSSRITCSSCGAESFNDNKTVLHCSRCFEQQKHWLNPEFTRPNEGQKIIFENAVGLFWGEFHATKDGVVHVDGKQFDIVDWDEIYQWVAYPKDF